MAEEREGTIFYASFESPWLGKVFVASTERGVCAVDFLTSEKAFLRYLKKRFPEGVVRDERKNRRILLQLKRYSEGKLRTFRCKLDLRGTPFQRKVWSFLMKIPYGQTCSYQEVARAVGHPRAFRAVGSANGANPIPLIIPCHRVIESKGGLGGFGHGLKVKKQLLDFERAHVL